MLHEWQGILDVLERVSFILGILFILWGLCEKGLDLLGVRELAVSNVSRTTCFENVLAALDASEEDSLAARVKRPVLLACVSAVETVVTNNTQETLVVNAGELGLDTGGELSGCCHALNMRTRQRGRNSFLRLFCVGGMGDWEGIGCVEFV
jgi:hypothetical protein